MYVARNGRLISDFSGDDQTDLSVCSASELVTKVGLGSDESDGVDKQESGSHFVQETQMREVCVTEIGKIEYSQWLRLSSDKHILSLQIAEVITVIMDFCC